MASPSASPSPSRRSASPPSASPPSASPPSASPRSSSPRSLSPRSASLPRSASPARSVSPARSDSPQNSASPPLRRHSSSFPEDLIAAEVAYAPDGVRGTAAYARLAGTGRGAVDYMLRSKSITLGRAGYGADCELRSDVRAVSRHHATIHWVGEARSWAITCFSRKGGLLVDGAPVLVGTPAMALRSRVLVEMGDCSFFFLACVEPFCRTADIGLLEEEVVALREARVCEEEEMEIERVRMEVEEEEERMRIEAERERRARARERSSGGDDDDDVALVGRKVSKKSRKTKKRRRESQSDDAVPEDDDARRKRKKDKKKKKKKKLKRQRLSDSQADPQEQWSVPSGGVDGGGDAVVGETEDEEEEEHVEVEVETYEQLGEMNSDAGGKRYENGNGEAHTEPEPSRPSSASKRKPTSRQTGDDTVRADWNKRERADFCRAIFAVDVDKVYDGRGRLVTYDWTRFRGIARLEKKSDAQLADFFVRMMEDMDFLLENEAREKATKGPRTKHKPGCDCVVCENTRKSRRRKEEQNRDDPDDEDDGGARRAIGGSGSGGEGGDEEAKEEQADKYGGVEDNHGSTPPPVVDRVLGLVTAQKLRVRRGIHEAARQVDSASGLTVMRKLKSQPRTSAANGDLPSWWENGVHDHALMIGTARHGVGQWYEIWNDVHNPEMVQVREDEGDEFEIPTPQVAMKRLREVSSAINAEIRRVAKKKAKQDEGPEPPSATKPRSRSARPDIASSRGSRPKTARPKARNPPVSPREDEQQQEFDSGEEGVEREEEGDEHRDEESGEVVMEYEGGESYGGGDPQVELGFDDGGMDDVEEEIEFELEEIEVEADEESSEEEKVAYHTASDSGQSD